MEARRRALLGYARGLPRRVQAPQATAAAGPAMPAAPQMSAPGAAMPLPDDDEQAIALKMGAR